MKTRDIAVLLLFVSIIMCCGCGSQKANLDESTAAVSEFSEDVAEAVNTVETAEPEPMEAPEIAQTEVEEESEKTAIEPEETEMPEVTVAIAPESTIDSREQTAPETAVEPEKEEVQQNETDTLVIDELGKTPEPEELSVEETTVVPDPEEERSDFVIPAVYAEPSYRIGEVKWNSNGSITYRLTKEEHERLLQEVHAYVQEELDTMCDSLYFPHFDSMTANEDCRVFTVVVIDIETSKAEQKSIPQLYELGRMYAAYQGVEPGNIHIDYMTKMGNTFVTRDSEKDEAMTKK